ncbi:Rrf2 family transcriptional regulator [Dietzia sp. PP-33]|jgi:Rrf2 family nitric oxide-sensitive transcriptional repressor|uniref:RrF2 family transcriptional regulator n=1 Tax=Dietzia sp. PP-33 TaxID=2957500 RepID=UPI0029A4EF21|nr:Rrf2 family transcriptional regulator [Dietzia sp. PP-33]MDX2357956.1 Rrf2 family transcriptional regulator [Dietzia sp. PP-33]
MQLSRYSDLALRALMRLAVADGRGDRMTAAGIAESVNASTSHVAKTVSRLVELGMVESRRGRGGGLVITEAGRRASVGQLLRELEGPGEVVECEGPSPCPLAGNCGLRRALVDAREAFFSALDPLTVAGIVHTPTRQVLLSLGPGP